jgi:hypothetical protein
MATEDKKRTTEHDQSDLLGMKPFSSIGADRGPEEQKVVGKLKKKKADSLRAEGSTFKDGEKANVGEVSKAIGNFVNGR